MTCSFHTLDSGGRGIRYWAVDEIRPIHREVRLLHATHPLIVSHRPHTRNAQQRVQQCRLTQQGFRVAAVYHRAVV
jgi:hypothetical protein